MESPQTAPLWRIVVGWCATALFGFGLIYGLISGKVAWGKSKVHYTRSHDPAAFWFIIAFHSLVFGAALYFLLKTRPPITPPAKPDLTPRDWMGNPLDRK